MSNPVGSIFSSLAPQSPRIITDPPEEANPVSSQVEVFPHTSDEPQEGQSCGKPESVTLLPHSNLPTRGPLPIAPLPLPRSVIPHSVIPRSAIPRAVIPRSLPIAPLPIPPSLAPRSQVVTEASSQVDASTSEGLITSKEERETFIKSVYYFADAKAKKSTNKTLKNLSIIIKLAKKLNIKYMHDEDVSTGAVAKAIVEISMKNNIQYNLATLHPVLPFVAKTSELINIFKPLLEDPLNRICQEAGKKLTHPAAHLDVIDQHCQAINNTLILTGCSLSKAVLQAASTPDALCSAIAAAYVDTTEAGLSLMGRGVHALGNGIDRSANFLRDYISDAIDAFKPTMEVLPFIEAGPEHVLRILQRQASSRQSVTQSQTDQNQEIQDRQTQEEGVSEVAPDENGQADDNSLDTTDRSTISTLNQRTCSTLKNPVWPNLNHSHPLTQILGGSFSISGGSSTGTTYAAQVNVKLSGTSGIIQPPAVQSASHMANAGGGQNTGRIRIHPEDQDKVVYRPIREERQSYVNALSDYEAKKAELTNAQNSFSPDDSFETYSTKCNDVIAKKRALEPFAQKVMNAAYEVHKLTCKEVRRKYLKEMYVNDQSIADLNASVKNFLCNEFGVPQKGELKREHLSESGTMQHLKEIEAAYTTNLEHAKLDQAEKSRIIQKKQEEIAKSHAAITNKNKEFEEMQAVVRAMENGDGFVDPVALSEKIATLKLLGDQLLVLVGNRALLIPESMKEADITTLQIHIEKSIGGFTLRDARYIKITGDYKRFCDRHASLLPKFIENSEKEGISQDLMETDWQAGVLENHIRELISQCPGNMERNAKLVSILENIASKSRDLSFCAMSFADKSAEIHALRNQIGSLSSPGQREKAVDTCHQRYSVLLCQLQSSREYEKFSDCFNQFLGFLLKEDTLSDWNIEIISHMSDFIRKGIEAQKIKPEEVIQLLEALESQNSFKPASPENSPLKSVDLNPLRITIGELMICSEQSTSERSRLWYEKCKKLQPQQLHWSRAIAACHLQTLHWSLAEQSLLEALTKNPKDENTKKAVEALVGDKYQSASLVLEWIQKITSTGKVTHKQKQSLSKLKAFTAGLIEVMNTSTHILSHPALLKKWLPSTLHLPTEFRPHLDTLLSRETSTNFNVFNITTFVIRVITAASSIVESHVSKEKNRKVIRIARGASFGANALQQLLTTVSDMLRLKSGTLAIRDKYMKKSLQRSDFLSATSSLSLPVAQHLPLAISLIQGVVYKDNQVKRRSQQAHPYMHAIIETLASRNFASTAVITDLMLRTTHLGSRALARLSGISSGRIETILKTASVGYFVIRTTQALWDAYAKIVSSLCEEESADSSTGSVSTYVSVLKSRISASKLFNCFFK